MTGLYPRKQQDPQSWPTWSCCGPHTRGHGNPTSAPRRPPGCSAPCPLHPPPTAPTLGQRGASSSLPPRLLRAEGPPGIRSPPAVRPATLPPLAVEGAALVSTSSTSLSRRRTAGPTRSVPADWNTAAASTSCTGKRRGRGHGVHAAMGRPCTTVGSPLKSGKPSCHVYSRAGDTVVQPHTLLPFTGAPPFAQHQP